MRTATSQVQCAVVLLVGTFPEASDLSDEILSDVELPGTSGFHGVEELLSPNPGMRVLMLTAFEDNGSVFRSLRRRASGHLLEKSSPVRILEAIREAGGGGAPMPREIADKVVRLLRTDAPRELLDDDLNVQERGLLKLLSEGHTYESAGSVMGVSINTVRSYVRSVYDKLHVHSKSAAVTRALRAGLI